MSQLVRLEGKHSTQNAHCALWTTITNHPDKREVDQYIKIEKVSTTTGVRGGGK